MDPAEAHPTTGGRAMRLVAGSGGRRTWGVRCSGRPVFTVGADVMCTDREGAPDPLFTLQLTPVAPTRAAGWRRADARD